MKGFELFDVRQHVTDGTRLECGIRSMIPPTARRSSRLARGSRRCRRTGTVRIATPRDPASWRWNGDGQGAYPAQRGQCRCVGRTVGRRLSQDRRSRGVRSADAAVGFRLFNGTIVAIMVTPWFMTVVSQADDLVQKAFEPRLPLNFPERNIEFALSEVEALGRIATYSLFSMMFDFADMIWVLATAEAAFPALMLPANAAEAVHWQEPATSTTDRCDFLHGIVTERHA